MSRKLRVALAALAISFVPVQNAVSADNLFKDFTYGSPISKYSKSSDYFDCSKLLGGTARCRNGADFLGEKFTLALIFTDSKLSKVSLLTPYSREIYVKTINTLEASFTPAIISDGKATLDIVDLASKEKKETGMAKVIAYEKRGLSAYDLSYFLYGGLHSLKDRKMNASSLLESLPRDTRVAQVMVIGTSEDTAIMTLGFSFPKRETPSSKDTAHTAIESF